MGTIRINWIAALRESSKTILLVQGNMLSYQGKGQTQTEYSNRLSFIIPTLSRFNIIYARRRKEHLNNPLNAYIAPAVGGARFQEATERT